jgi:hypothetical protein
VIILRSVIEVVPSRSLVESGPEGNREFAQPPGQRQESLRAGR